MKYYLILYKASLKEKIKHQRLLIKSERIKYATPIRATAQNTGLPNTDWTDQNAMIDRLRSARKIIHSLKKFK